MTMLEASTSPEPTTMKVALKEPVELVAFNDLKSIDILPPVYTQRPKLRGVRPCKFRDFIE